MSEMPIVKDYEGSVCEIKTMDNDLIAIGKIQEINDKILRISSQKKELKVVDYGTLIKVNIFNADLGFRVIVGNVYTSTKGEISIASVLSLVNRERRNFFRVDMDLNAKLIYNESAYRTREIHVKVLDMSLSGIRFQCNTIFNVGSQVSVSLCLNNQKNHSFPCKIVRSITNGEGEELQYGCEFTGSNEDASDALCSFLFQKQREFLNRRKNV